MQESLFTMHPAESARPTESVRLAESARPAETDATADSALFAPVSAKERISSVDVIRGVALLGILLMNIISFGLPGQAYMDPTVAGGATGANLAFWLVNQILFEGKMRAIFSMLFGAGVIILTSRAENRGGEARAGIADIYYRRTLWLFAFGLLHAYFIWVGDILYSYGLVGLMLYPLRKAAPKYLIVAGLALLSVLVPINISEGQSIRSMRAEAAKADADAAAGKTLTDEQREAQKAWTEKLKQLKPPAAEIAKEIKDHRSGYWTLFPRRAREAGNFESVFFYHFIFFDVAGMMLLGMAFMKLGVFSAARTYQFYWAMVLGGYGIGIPVNAYVGYRNIAGHFEPAAMAINFSFYDLGRLTVALGHVGLVMLLVKTGALRWLSSRLAAVGQMALTNYLMHSMVCTLIFNGYGLGWFGQLQRYQLLYIVFGLWTFQLIASPIWLGNFLFGPMEWVWRSLTYWHKQPMRIRATPPLPEAQSATA